MLHLSTRQRPPRCSLFPYTTLFRSADRVLRYKPRLDHHPEEWWGRDAIFERSDVDPLEKDRKSTRLNSSHLGISYAVFCLKKKNKYEPSNTPRLNLT